MQASGRRSLGSIAAVCLGAFMLSACSVVGGPGPPPVDTVWRVVELDGRPVPRLPDNRSATLALDSQTDMASGFTGCNRMTAGYLLDGDQLSFGSMGTTRMACDKVSAETEMMYSQTLSHVARWRRRDDRLELRDANGNVTMKLEVAGRVDALPPR